MAPYFNRARRCVIETGDQLYQGSFTGTGTAKDSDSGSGSKGKRNILENVFFSVKTIFERDVLKLNGTVWDLCQAILWRLDDRYLGEYFADTMHAGNGARRQQKNTRNHHERVHNQQHVAHKTRKLANSKRTGHNHPATKKQNGNVCHIHGRLKCRNVHN